MAKYDKIFPETHQEAMKIARSNQKPGQTQLIPQGILKGIDEYKKQMKVRARKANRQKKLQSKAKQNQQAQQDNEQDEALEVIEVTRHHPQPWALLVASWLFFVAVWLWLR